MAMAASSNIASLGAQIDLERAAGGLASSIRRLSTGLRVNSAADDPAALAIGDRMTARLNGMSQAIRNSNDGISALQIADRALASMVTSLQRLRQLAVQSGNSSNSLADRTALDQEAQQLVQDIGQTIARADFNGHHLLDGSFNAARFQVGADAGQTLGGGIPDVVRALAASHAITSFQYQVTGANVSGAALDALSQLAINGTVVGPSVAVSGRIGFGSGSAAALAAAINAAGTGVIATASTSLASGVPSQWGGLGTGDISINGIAVGGIGGGSDAASQGSQIAQAINAVSSSTGVTAAAATTGALTLNAVDGRDISILMTGSATVANTGLPQGPVASAQGQQPDLATIVAQGSGTVPLSLTLNGSAVAALAVPVLGAHASAQQKMAAWLSALAAAINGPGHLGTGNVTATVTGGGLLLTAANAGAIVVGGGADAYTGLVSQTYPGTTTPLTTHGMLTLTSSSQFTLSNAAGAGLDVAGLTNALVQNTPQHGVVDLNRIADLTSGNGVAKTLAQVDAAIATFDEQRANLGGMANALAANIGNLQLGVGALSAARSRIMDTDFALETASLASAQILRAAATAMLVQANASPNAVLRLLR
jgi:flagellin